MTILNLIENCGNIYTKKASTRGGEYSGPCPWCGGDDRFSIHPEQDHYVCRQCKKAGDSISFLKDYHHKTYMEACKELNITPQFQYKSLDTTTERPGQNEIVWTPREIKYPPAIWQDKAAAFLFESYKYLLSPAGKIHRNWLNARGISNSTIKTARFGWNTHSISFDMESWGITPEKSKTGKNKQIWLPEGLIIPYFRDDKPIRLRIRQSNPVTSDRFIMVAGSSMGYFDYTAHQNKTQDLSNPVLVTEAELDGWLLYQELGDLFQIYAVGNASTRPDDRTHAIIKNFPILLNLDDDTAGHTEQAWWKNQYPNTLTWYSEFGKDPGESFEVGVDIRAWGKEGLKKLKSTPNNLQPIVSNQENFKSKILAEYQKKQPEQKVEIVEQIQKPRTISKITTITTGACAHNKFCNSLKDTICLINNKNPFEDLFCPKNQWYPHTTGNITEIILSPGVKK